MRKSKIVSIFVGILSLIAIMVVSLTGCNNSKYFEEVSSYKFWENTGSTSIAQTNVYNMVKEHMAENNGSTKKVISFRF